ncbi:GcrA family cell cycle regulator [Bradyrhizobium sp. 174]|uniref:GcrA family cell cycle regulator n=1 Tax=Bradyrhizobium sp. 174 TaxID=2782645 RepID=UPI001FF977B9|nr:GcrA family cell cycle regulator [Bradyrhizobium sp. 174]MCK1577854.1 GcrA cell cycle regulator [Bradyrhizobium sp. 174]
MPVLTWSDDRIEQLKKLWEAGLSASQIAAELGGGISRNAAIGKIHRLGLSGRAKGYPGPSKRQTKPPRPLPGPSRRVVALRKAIEEASNDTHASNLEAAAEFDPSVISVSDAEIPAERRVSSIIELEDHHCRWPVGEVGTPGFFFCGGNKLDGLPYCAGHCRAAYQSPAERREGSRNISEEERARRSARMKQLHATRRAASA